MKKQEAINKNVFVFDHDGEIVERNLYEHIMMSEDQTTSPVGVMGRWHIRHEDLWCSSGRRNHVLNTEGNYEVWTWGPNGNYPSFIKEFESEEEAEEFIFNKIYSDDFLPDDQRHVDYYDTKEEAEAVKKTW